MAAYSAKVVMIRTAFTSTIGWIKRSFGVRRSRKDWPGYDNAYLWHGEEAYEYNHSGTIDEYMDVLGTIMILQIFHTYEFHNRVRRASDVSRKHFKEHCIKWWLRQNKRGRPNLPLKLTYYHFSRIHRNLKTLNTKNENEKSKHSG